MKANDYAQTNIAVTFVFVVFGDESCRMLQEAICKSAAGSFI